MMKKAFYLLCLMAFSFGFAQTPDVFRAEYMLMPRNSVDVRTSRFKLVGNAPIPVGKDYIIVGGEYNYYDYLVPENTFSGAEEIGNLYVIDINLAYMHEWNEDWKVIGLVTPRWASNFNSESSREDFNVNFTVGAFKEKKDIDKPYRLITGISYNSSSPVQIPLPFIYYEKRFHPSWSYTLGVPKTGLKHFTKKQHFFQTELILDGYYVNIQKDILLSDNSISTAISSTTVLATFGYQYKFTKEISLYLMSGYTLFQSAVLRDKDRNDIFTINNGPGLYFRTGFRIGI